MISLFSDISALTGIPKLTLEKLCNKGELCIADSVLEKIISKEYQASIDIGIGILNIRIEDAAIKYKFIPAKELDTMICSAINSKTSPLVRRLDSALNDRITSTYKELL
jgi:hypothetical protein